MLGLGLGLRPKAHNPLNLLALLQPFVIEKFVATGASITDDAFGFEISRLLCEAIAEQHYNKTVSVFERARPGDDVEGQSGLLPIIFNDYDDDPNVVYANHIGGNDISYGTEFLNTSASAQSQAISDYNQMLTDFETGGRKVFPFGLTFRNVNGTGLDLDPTSPKINELTGSYTYNRDWIEPIIASRLPTLIRNGDLAFTNYDYTRSIYDIYLSADNVHPTEMGSIMLAIHMFKAIMEASEGRYISAPQNVNFNNAFQSPDVNIDIVIATHVTSGSITPSNSNINWIAAPYGNASDKYTLYSDDLHNTDGSNANGISVLYAGIKKSFPVSTQSGDTSATLNNSVLRNSYVGVTESGARIAALIEGLQPNRTYEISTCRLTSSEFATIANTATESTPATDQIVTISTRADPYGRIIVRNRETSSGNTAGFSGLRIRSI